MLFCPGNRVSNIACDNATGTLSICNRCTIENNFLPDYKSIAFFLCWFSSFPLSLIQQNMLVIWLNCCCAMLSSFSQVRLFATLWTVAHQAPLSMGFSRQEYRSGLPLPSLFYLWVIFYLPRITVASLYCKSMFNSVRNCQTVFWSGHTIVHPLQYWVIFPVAVQPG